MAKIQQKIVEEEEKAARDNRANQKNPNNRKYKRPVLFLHKSKAGEHVFLFNAQAKDENGNETDVAILGGEVESLIANISDVAKVIDGTLKWCKVSVMVAEGGD